MEFQEDYNARMYLTRWDGSTGMSVDMNDKREKDIIELLKEFENGGNLFELIPLIPRDVF